MVSSQVWGGQRSHDAPAIHHASASWPTHQHASGSRSHLSSDVGTQAQGMGRRIPRGQSGLAQVPRRGWRGLGVMYYFV